MNSFLRLRSITASRRQWRGNISLLVVLLAGLPRSVLAVAGDELTELSLEQLMDVSIVSASRFTQKASEVASAVTVITRAEIQQYGWRNIAEALRSVPGFFIHNGRDYDYIGARGFARPQDYNSRVLLLIDGYRTNDSLYDMAYVGTEQLIDIDLVERIEVVRGPGSSVYGGNALFGVINVITRTAEQIDGVEVGAGLASYNSRAGRVTYGGRSKNGVELVASVSGMKSDGPNLYFPEFDAPETNFGRTSKTDSDSNSRFFTRLSYAGLSLTAAGSQREKGVGSGAYGSVFGDPSNKVTDSQAYVDLAYTRSLSTENEVSGRLYWGNYNFNWPANYGDPPVLNQDKGDASWWGSELKWVSSWSPRNKLVSGVEYQSNYQQKQWNYDSDPYQPYLNDLRSNQRFGFFLQNDFQWTESLNISLGARYDKISDFSGELSPRLGMVYRSSEQTLWKLQYGTAFRAPNAYERFYDFPGSQTGNPSGLQPEKIATYGAGVEHYLAKQTRLAVTAYYYKMSNLIEQVATNVPANPPESDAEGEEAVEADVSLLQYVNVGTVTARGLELEAEHQFDNSARVRLSLDLLQTKNAAGKQLTNSPQAMVKLLGWAPLPWLKLRLGVDAQWLDSRKTDLGTVPSYGVTNVTLLKPTLSKSGWQLSASVFNLFDHKYADPAAFDTTVPTRDRFEQNGRTFRVKAIYHF